MTRARPLVDDAAELFNRLDRLWTAIRLLGSAKEELVGDFRQAMQYVIYPQLSDLIVDMDKWKDRYTSTARGKKTAKEADEEEDA
jgi:hypothetical protein